MVVKSVKMKPNTFLFFIVLILSACTKELDLPFPNYEPQIVVVGFLHQDSTVLINVSQTLPPESTDENFPLINNANIKFFENETLVDTLIYEGDGNYKLDYYPKPGYNYSIEVAVPGFKTLYATDKLPQKPSFEVCYEKRQKGGRINSILTIERPLVDNFYWISLQVKDYSSLNGDPFKYDSSKTYTLTIFHLLSNTPFLDDFNAFFDNIDGINVYSPYIRIGKDGFKGNEAIIDVTNFEYRHFQYERIQQFDENQSLKAYLFSMSATYDQYLKSSLINFANTELSKPTPFTPSVNVYSNIQNGTGIFAAYNSAMKRIEDYPCN